MGGICLQLPMWGVVVLWERSSWSLLKHLVGFCKWKRSVVFKMLNDLTVLAIFFVFWLVVCVLFLVIYSLEQEHEANRKKSLKDWKNSNIKVTTQDVWFDLYLMFPCVLDCNNDGSVSAVYHWPDSWVETWCFLSIPWRIIRTFDLWILLT